MYVARQFDVLWLRDNLENKNLYYDVEMNEYLLHSDERRAPMVEKLQIKIPSIGFPCYVR